MAGRRVAVLISGGGSNLQALIDATTLPASRAAIVLVISNRTDAYGLTRARDAGIPAETIAHGADRGEFEAQVTAALVAARVDLVCLAGFMRILSAAFVARWRDRILNIHPSLLPAFPGLHTHARALAAGVRVHGCTVHLVRPELDAGPILVQGIVPVLTTDDPSTLAARVLEVEHRCYPLALELLASGALAVAGDRIEGDGQRLVLHPTLRTT